MARVLPPIALGALLAAGCASAPLPAPKQAMLITGGCSSVVADGPPGSYRVLARVSVDVPWDAEERVIQEALAGRACGYGANAILPDGVEELIPLPTFDPIRPARSVLQSPMLGAPVVTDSQKRVFALAIRLER
jgi:hypothetical protein